MTDTTLNFSPENLPQVHRMLALPEKAWALARAINDLEIQRLKHCGAHLLALEATRTNEPEAWLRGRMDMQKAAIEACRHFPAQLKAEDARLRAVHADSTAKARQVRATNQDEITRLEGHIKFLPSRRKAEADKLKQSGLRDDQIQALLEREEKFDPTEMQERIAVLKAENDAINAFLATSPFYDFTLLAGTSLAEEETE